MPPRRMVVDSGITPERIQPAASPVDTFVQPPRETALSQLAQGLQQFAPELQQFANGAFQKQADEQTAAGQQAAREASDKGAKTWSDAVKQGLVKPGQNPYFIAAFKGQNGRVAAAEYQNQLDLAVRTDPRLQASTDIADFHAVASEIRGKVQSALGGDSKDPYFQKNFGRLSDAYTEDAGRTFTNVVAHNIETQAGDNLYTLHSQALDAHFTKDGPDAVLQMIQAENAAYLKNNPKAGQIVNRKTTQALVDYALKLENDGIPGGQKVLALAERIGAGPGGSLGQTREAREMVIKAQDEIRATRQQIHTMANAEDETRKKDAEKSFFNDFTTALEANKDNPNLVPMASFVQRFLNDVGGDRRDVLGLYSMQRSYAERRSEGDDLFMRNLELRVQGVDPGREGQYLTMRQVAGYAEHLSPQQVGRLMNAVQERDLRWKAEGEKEDKMGLTSPVYSWHDHDVRGAFVSPYGINSDANLVRARDASRDFRSEWMRQKVWALPKAEQETQAGIIADQAIRAHASPEVLRLREKAAKGTTALHSPQEGESPAITVADLNALDAEMKSIGTTHAGFSSLAKRYAVQFKLDSKEKLDAFVKQQRALYQQKK